MKFKIGDRVYHNQLFCIGTINNIFITDRLIPLINEYDISWDEFHWNYYFREMIIYESELELLDFKYYIKKANHEQSAF